MGSTKTNIQAGGDGACRGEESFGVHCLQIVMRSTLDPSGLEGMPTYAPQMADAPLGQRSVANGKQGQHSRSTITSAVQILAVGERNDLVLRAVDQLDRGPAHENPTLTESGEDCLDGGVEADSRVGS